MKAKWPVTCTLIFSLFIVIGAGHGISCTGIAELALLLSGFGMGDGEFYLLPHSYDQSLPVAMLLFFVGHLCLGAALLFNYGSPRYRRLVFAGLLSLWGGFFYLTHQALYHDSLAAASFYTGLPFCISSLLLCIQVTGKRWPAAGKKRYRGKQIDED
jgi:hypothetical protein